LLHRMVIERGEGKRARASAQGPDCVGPYKLSSFPGLTATPSFRRPTQPEPAVPNSIPAALSPAEWAGVLANRKSLDTIRDQFMDTPFSPHALAALLLYDEPHGFTAQDVEDEREVAAYCRAMTKQHTEAGKEEMANTFRLLGERHEIRADKIAALLPPGSVIPPRDIAERAD
jgi:hypothetical protein